jgi:hypothetical protein
MEWISVKDRLPEIGQSIIFFCVDHIRAGKYYATFSDNSDLGFYDLCCNYDFDNVTHWMPIPQFPKE